MQWFRLTVENRRTVTKFQKALSLLAELLEYHHTYIYKLVKSTTSLVMHIMFVAKALKNISHIYIGYTVPKKYKRRMHFLSMCGNLFIDLSMFTSGLRNLALTILQLFPKSIITGLFSDPSTTTLLLFRSLCKKPLSWMKISISHVCFKIFAHMATS